VICKEAERAISRVLSAKTNYFIQPEISWEGEKPLIRLFGYRKSGIGVEEVEFSPAMVDEKAVRLIRNRLTRSLETLQALKDYEKLSKAISTVKKGIIRRIDKENALHVEMLEGPLSGWTAKCNWRGQPPRERGTYRIGQVLLFYVNNVGWSDHQSSQGKMSIRIELNRTSPNMPVFLLYDALAHFGHSTVGMRIECIQRVPGGKTVFFTSRRVPKEAIALVSSLLKEKVRVRYGTAAISV